MESNASQNFRSSTGLTKTEKTLIRVFKSLSLPCDLATWVAAVKLKTERQQMQMAIWLWDGKITDQNLIVEKAQELAKLEA